MFGSTGSNYGGVDQVCTEKTKLNPLTVYAKTKADMYLDIPSEQVNEGTQEVISQNILKEEETDNDKISGDSKS